MPSPGGEGGPLAVDEVFAGDGSLRVGRGELAYSAGAPSRLRSPCRGKLSTGQFSTAAPTPFHCKSKKKPTRKGWCVVCHPERSEGSLNGKTRFPRGDGSLRAIFGELALWAAFPLACAPHAAENCPPDSFLPRLRLPASAIPKRKPPVKGGFLFGAGDGSLRAIFGLLALCAAQALACAPRGRGKAPLGLFLPALRLPSMTGP